MNFPLRFTINEKAISPDSVRLDPQLVHMADETGMHTGTIDTGWMNVILKIPPHEWQRVCEAVRAEFTANQNAKAKS